MNKYQLNKIRKGTIVTVKLKSLTGRGGYNKNYFENQNFRIVKVQRSCELEVYNNQPAHDLKAVGMKSGKIHFFDYNHIASIVT